MATETEGSFGRVSRLRGVVFEYVTLAASLVGIVSLGILLIYVTIDAFGLEAASPAWFLVYFLTLVAPVGAFSYYARKNPEVKDAALGVLTVAIGGLMVAIAGVIVLSVIVGPDVWFAHSLILLGVPGALLAYARYDPSASWVGSAAPLAFLLGIVSTTVDDALLAVGQQLASPFDVVTLPERVLTDAAVMLGAPGVYFLTLVVPVATGAYWYVASRYERRQGLIAAALIVVAAFAGVPVVDQLRGVSRGSWLIALTGFFVPVGYIVTRTATEAKRRQGLALPAILVGGSLLGAAVVDLFGVTKPEPWLRWYYLTNPPSSIAADAGLYPAIVGSVFIIVLVALLTFVLGVGAAIYLEEYAPSSGLLGSFTRFIQVNISNLAGVPSIVYGLLGLGVFIKLFALGFGTVAVAAMTLSLLILPIVIISAQEAIRSVPDDLRNASYGMGATRWQTIKNVVLPESLPGILTGTILALGRAIGETAPLLMIGIPNFVTTPPAGPFSRTTAMPMLIFEWAFYPEADFRYGVVAAGVVALLLALLAMNSVAIFVRNKYQRST
ncbi:MAG: phosphate ABC transporter permease PstA [Haloarculaceae archaeon]